MAAAVEMMKAGLPPEWSAASGVPTTVPDAPVPNTPAPDAPTPDAPVHHALDYRLLGPLTVLRGGTAVGLGGRRQRAVLAMLLLAANRTVSTDALVDGVWSGAPPAQALATLHGYITHLRRALEPGRAPRAPARVLLREAGGYRLAVPGGGCDLDRFADAVTRARTALAAGDPVAAARLARRGLDEWRGPALSDFADELFAAGHVRRLEDERLQAVELWIDAELAAGRHDDVLGEVASLSAEHPTRERFRAQHMLALYRAGRQADALEVASAGRRRLADELGIDPDPALQALEAAILRQDPDLDRRPGPLPGRDVTGAVGPTARTDEQTEQTEQPRALAAGPAARTDERAALTRALAAARSGDSRVVLVAGEPGIGKTWLLETFAAGAADARVVWGRCNDADGAPPYWPWRQMLRGLAPDLGPDALRALLGRDAAVVVDVAPELSTHLDAPPPVRLPDAETARFHFFDAVGRLLEGLAGQRPLILLLEDMHWADPSSLALLRSLVPRLPRGTGPEAHAGVLIVATYRDVAAGDRDRLAPTLGALAREPVVERLRLRGLTTAGTAALVTGLLGAVPDAAVTEAIAERTGGNPLFVVHLARLLQEMTTEGAAGDDGRTGTGELIRTRVPAAVVDLIGWQVAELPEATRRVLELAAIAGRDFDLDLLVRTQALSHERAVDALEPAVAAGIIGETIVGGQYRFTHALIREAIVAGMGPARIARLHGRVGDALAAAGDDPRSLPVVAHHYWMAAQVGWAPQALDTAVAAADAALSGLAFEAAQGHLDRARQLLDTRPVGPERDRAELGIRLQSATHLMRTRGYGVEEVGVTCRRARELAPRSAPEYVVASWGLAAHHLVRGEHRAAMSIGGQLLELAGQTGNPVAALAGHQTSGVPSIYLAGYDVAVEHLTQVVDIAAALPEAMLHRFPQDVRAGGLAFLALAEWLRGDTDTAERRRGEAVAMGTDAGGYDEVFVRMVSSQMGVLARSPQHVLDDTAVMLEACGDTGFAHLAAHARIMRGWALALTGQAEDGLTLLRRGMDHFTRYERSARRAHNLTLLAEALARSGRRERAAGAIDAAIAEVTAAEERFFEPEIFMIAARILPDDDRAPQWLERAVDAAAAAGAGPLHERVLGLRAGWSDH